MEEADEETDEEETPVPSTDVVLSEQDRHT
jgi:hypothetical protein